MNATATTSSDRQVTVRFTKLVWAIVIAGVGLRLCVQILMAGNLNTDPDAYVQLSQTLAAGNGFSGTGSTTPTAFRPPLFPLLLAIPQWLGISGTISIATVQLVASALLLIATFYLAKLIKLGQVSATIAVATVACDPLLLVYSSFPMTEVVAAAFLTWAAVFMLQIRQRLSVVCAESTSIKSVVGVGLFAGCCFGFGGLCRPILFVACAISSIVFFLATMFHDLSAMTSFRKNGKVEAMGRGLLKRLMAASIPALVAAIILCPWVIRNAVHFEHFIPATTHGGYTLLLGNNPVFYAEVVNRPDQPRWAGDSLQKWNQLLENEMQAAGIPQADEVRRDHWMYERAKANIAADPVSFRRACLLRMKRFGAIVPTAAIEKGTAAKVLIGLFYGIIALGLVVQPVSDLGGFFYSRDETQPKQFPAWLLWSIVFAFAMMHSVYWTNTRMRAPLTPLLIALSVVGYRSMGSWYFGYLKWRRDKSVGDC